MRGASADSPPAAAAEPGFIHSHVALLRADDPRVGALREEYNRFARFRLEDERVGRAPVIGVFAQDRRSPVLADVSIVDARIGRPPAAVQTYGIDTETLALLGEAGRLQQEVEANPTRRGIQSVRALNEQLLERGYTLHPRVAELAALATLNYLETQGKGLPDMGDDARIVDRYLRDNSTHTFGVIMEVSRRQSEARGRALERATNDTALFAGNRDEEDSGSHSYDIVEGPLYLEADDDDLDSAETPYSEDSDAEFK